MKHGDQIRIAEWLGLKPAFLSRILSGEKRPSPRRSENLEKISGIPMRHWLLLDHEELKRMVFISWAARSDRTRGGR